MFQLMITCYTNNLLYKTCLSFSPSPKGPPQEYYNPAFDKQSIHSYRPQNQDLPEMGYSKNISF